MVDPAKKDTKKATKRNYPNRNRGINGSIALRFEDMSLKTTYAISLNPKDFPLKLGGEDPKFPFSNVRIWYRSIYDAMVPFGTGLNLVLYPESSPTGRLHFHGTITIKNFHVYYNFLNYWNNKANYEIDTIKEEDAETMGWIEYCTKQKHIWLPVFEPTVIGYPMKVSHKSDFVEAPRKKKPKLNTWDFEDRE